ncbi:transcriptional regulator family: HMG [Penicillium brevicompactum]|uniref:Transcriptional regulator family: HMG n=1 Tax=Penicillium brevicompactum TaxID=5074 RepID=A0A9W9QIE7_PENBR|nr:transcriptional regulator family: HMG [Penicillium brevicompactum]
MAPAMSTLVGAPTPPTVPAGFGAVHLEMLLFRYIETLEMHHAMRVLARWPNDSPPGVFAAEVLAELPSNYFQLPRLLPTGPRFVFINHSLVLRRVTKAVAMQLLDPAATAGCVGTLPITANPVPVPVPVQPQRRLRPLNSFMIFRSFCSGLFPGIPQRVKSMAISQMWAEDTLKPQWAVLAKAYTIVRDHFLVSVPSLQIFVEECLPLIGLSNAPQYATMCGWSVVSEEGAMNLVKSSGPTVSQRFVPHPISVRAVVEWCIQRGYATPRNEEWPKYVLEGGSVFAVDRSGDRVIEEPQDWVIRDVPQWPTEEFEADEMYSDIDDNPPTICEPAEIDYGMDLFVDEDESFDDGSQFFANAGALTGQL